jgi:hypothetical protein
VFGGKKLEKKKIKKIKEKKEKKRSRLVLACRFILILGALLRSMGETHQAWIKRSKRSIFKY